MSKNYSKSSLNPKRSKLLEEADLYKLGDMWRRCWTGGLREDSWLREIEREYLRKLKIKMSKSSSCDLLKPEQRRILKEADYETLIQLLKKCQREKLPHDGMVEEIEKEIYKKWVRKNYPNARKYKLDVNLIYEVKK